MHHGDFSCSLGVNMNDIISCPWHSFIFAKRQFLALGSGANIKKERLLLENIQQGTIVQHMLPKVLVSKNMSDDIHNIKIRLYNIA